MLKNYLKVIFRNIKNNKLYASLNIVGLAVGLASFFVIVLFINNELAYDKFHEKKDRIYRALDVREMDTGEEKGAGLTAMLGSVATESPF